MDAERKSRVLKTLYLVAVDRASTAGEKSSAIETIERLTGSKYNPEHGRQYQPPERTYQPRPHQPHTDKWYADHTEWSSYGDWEWGPKHQYRTRPAWDYERDSWLKHKVGHTGTPKFTRLNGKMHIEFAESLCTDKQWHYMLLLCRILGMEPPKTRITFTEASDWLNHYAGQ